MQKHPERTVHVASANLASSQPSSTIEQRVRMKLSSGGYRELRHISCSFHEGVVVLHGLVASFFLKQLAQELTRDVEQVERVINRIGVRAPVTGNDL